ncbi:MAG TPA: hypothetical protein VES19_11910 [Candidatus Limnocylindrales bacterium]|nr:hypothetical protein [Candidatus Limnocylindrales bacterium]
MRTAVVLAVQAIGILLAVVLAGAAGMVASIVALVVVIVGPGLVVTRLLTAGERLGLAAASVYATGLGITLAIALGIVLDRTPFGIAWLGPILALIALSGIGWWLWPSRDRRPVGRRLRNITARYAMTSNELVVLLMGLTLTTGAFVIARIGAVQTLDEGAQLWIVAAQGVAEVGAANTGSHVVEWRVLGTTDRGELFNEPLTLASGQRWVATIELPDAHGPITVDLVDRADGTTLRQVHLAGDG